MYVGIILVSLIGYLSFLLLDQAARLIIPWKPEAVE
jgi:ABC-type nitrate/sulfonate/bicarbonate transport system permease component